MTNVIKTCAAYEAALARIEAIFDAVPDTAAAIELELLSRLVEYPEEARFPIDVPDSLTAIRFRAEQQAMPHRAA